MQKPEPDTRLAALESLGRQSRKHASLVPEFKHTKVMPLSQVPAEGCKVLQPPSQGGDAGETKNPTNKNAATNPQVEVGFFHSQQEFFAKALKPKGCAPHG